ncbi:MAG: WD40/YVTN/BNR-like repeat-containing protein [Phycisphaerae bacterium]
MIHRTLAAIFLAIALAGATARGEEGPKSCGFDVIGIGGSGGIFTPTVHPDDPKIVFVSCDMSGAYRSTDGGNNWTLLHYKQISNCNTVRPAFSKDTMYWARQPGTLLASKDKGLTWSPVIQGTPPFKGTLTHIAASRTKDGFLAVGTGEGLWVSVDAGKTWKQIQQRACNGMAIDGETAFAAVNKEGIFRSKDGGKTWEAVTCKEASGHAITSLAATSDRDSSCLYAVVQGVGVLQSLDQGTTWKKVQDWDGQLEVLILPNQTKVAYTAQEKSGALQMWRTTDMGETWKALIEPGAANINKHWTQTLLYWGYYIVPLGPGIDPTNPDVAFFSTQAELDRTTDGGKTWQQICDVVVDEKGPRLKSNGLEVTVSSGYLVSPHNPKDHYILYQDIGFARSRDAGATWTSAVKGCPWQNTFYAVAFDPFVKDRLYAACSRKHMIPDWIAIGAESRETAGGICVSDDGGSTWKVLNDKLPLRPATGLVIDPKSTKDALTMYVGLYDGGVQKSTDGGKTWIDKSKGLGNPGNVHVCRLYQSPKSGNLYCLITGSRNGREFKVPGGVWKSTDGGESWQDLTADLKLAWPTDVAVSDDEKTLILSAATTPVQHQGGAWLSTDGGKTWTQTLNDTDVGKWIPPSYVHAISVRFHPDQPNVAYLGTLSGLWYSKDAGKTWKPYEQVPFRAICTVSFDPANTKQAYICTQGVSVLRGPYLPQQ